MNVAAETPKEHNLPVPPPEAIVTVHLSNMRRAQDEASSMQGAMRSVFSRAEAKGLHLPAAKRALKILKSGKGEELAEELKELLRYLNIMGVGLPKSQLDLFETASVLAPIDEKGFDDGLRAGRLGEPGDNPHDLSTPQGQRWMDGYHRGSEERRLVLAMEAAEDSEVELIPGDDADEGQADIEDEEPFGGPWPDDVQVAAHAAE